MSLSPNLGRIAGWLGANEDRQMLEACLREAKKWVVENQVRILLHSDQYPAAGDNEGNHQKRIGLLQHGRLKRYVLRLLTSAGPRIVKINEVVTFGNHLVGFLGTSPARLEHHRQLRTQKLELAATQTCGFLEWRSGLLLRRSCQIQTCLEPKAVNLDTFFRKELAQFGEQAVEQLALAMAYTHQKGFFHADLKGFHAFPQVAAGPKEQVANYTLKWIDLGRVSFSLSRRQRIINLYQVFRFVLPQSPSAQMHFMFHYCRATKWYAHKPDRALSLVRKFLEHKLKTHPQVLS